MAQRPQIRAEPREVGRKATLHALRRAGKIPGVIYGRGEPQAVSLDGRAVQEFLRQHATTALIELQVDSDQTTAMFKQVDVHPVTGQVWHVDVQRVSLSDTVTARVPLNFGGIEEVEREGGVLTYQISELTVHCRADHLPETIAVDVSGLRPGDLFRISDLRVPEGVNVEQTAEQVVVACTIPAGEIAAEAELAEAEAARAAAAEAAPPPPAEEA
jgi:large subunit ribosomal protein L25